MLRHDIHNNQWIDKIRKIHPCKITMTVQKLTRLFFKKNLGSRYF